MRPIKKITSTFFVLLFFSSYFIANAQKENLNFLSSEETSTIIDSISKLVKTYYVSEAIGEQIGNLILSKHTKGLYKTLKSPNELAVQLTSDLRSVNGDLHMSVNYNAPTKTSKKSKRSVKIDQKGEWTNYGFQEIKVLDGNVGYLKINHFTNWNNFENAKKTITSSFNTLRNSDALIIDVRNNGGGFEEIVAYLISYLYDGEPIHLSDYYYRYEDTRSGVWTTKDIQGKKLPNIPVYVLVNSRTGSAAESLAYMLKHLKRATVIGETTMGAGNGAMTHKINEDFSVTIASETTINTVTKTSFEQVGVIPNIKTPSDNAFPKAYLMALNHLKDHNKKDIDPSNYNTLIDFLPKEKSANISKVNNYERYLGTYKNANLEIKISQNGEQLYAEIIGKGGQIKLIPREDHVFVVDNLKERIQFVLNEKQEVIKLIGIDSPMELEKLSN